MVDTADVVVSWGGKDGTRTVLNLAFGIEKPTLPIPFSKGKSESRWNSNKEEIAQRFSIEKREIKTLEQLSLSEMSEKDIIKYAKKLTEYILRGFRRVCFVAMPYDDEHDSLYEKLIRPTLDSENIEPNRIDRSGSTSDVLRRIHQGIVRCDGFFADITKLNPNVLYEIGYANAQNKELILFHRIQGNRKKVKLPFDIRNLFHITYTKKTHKKDIKLLRETVQRVFLTGGSNFEREAGPQTVLLRPKDERKTLLNTLLVSQ